MNLLAHTHALTFLLPGTIGLLFFLWALKSAPWRALLTNGARLHLYLGFTLGLSFFWSWLTVNVQSIFQVHLLLITTMVFIFGLRLSLIAGAAATLLMHLLLHNPWQNMGFHYFINVLTPVLISRSILHFISKIRVQNIFIYTLGGGFLGSMISVLGTGLMAIVTLWLSHSTLVWPTLDHSYLFLLLLFPEGFSNGAIISTLTILKPDLVKTYDDSFYLDGK